MAIFSLFDCFIIVHGSLYSHMQLLFTRLLVEYESGRCQLTLGINKWSRSGGLRSGWAGLCVRNTIGPHWTDITKGHPNFRLHDHTYVCRRCRGMYTNRLVLLRYIHLETTFERPLVANL